MPTYDPLTTDVTVDATIGAVTYIVTDFNDSGAASVGPDFQGSDGSYRGCAKRTGARDASMTIERTNAAQAIPAQFATFTYRGNVWLIQQVGMAMGSTNAATHALSLRWVSVAS